MSTVAIIYCNGQRLVDRPLVSIQPCEQGHIADACTAGPVCQCKRDAVVCDASIVPLIVCLLDRRCPPTIFFRVVTLVVNTVKAAAGRALSHVSKECRKVMRPLSADSYPSTAVIGIVGAFRVVTARLRMAPRGIFRAVRLSVCATTKTERVLPVASTAYRSALSQDRAENFGCVSALTTTKPCGPFSKPGALGRSFDHRQASKRLTSQVDMSWFHWLNYNTKVKDLSPGEA